jgi:hypothetical protein
LTENIWLINRIEQKGTISSCIAARYSDRYILALKLYLQIFADWGFKVLLISLAGTARKKRKSNILESQYIVNIWYIYKTIR